MRATKLRGIYSIFSITILGIITGFTQVTTIVNYNFNSGSSYGTLTPGLVTGISCSAGSTETFTVYSGTATASNAFTTNSTAGNALMMANSSGANIRYFQFQLGGSNLSLYHSYKIYFQSRMIGAGAKTIRLAYSTDGTNYSNLSTQSSGTDSYSECSYDLSAISSLNVKSDVYFRLIMSEASGTGGLAIDNFQVRATKCTTPAGVSIGSGQAITCSSSSVTLTGSSTTPGVTYSWSPGGATTSSITVTAAGSYSLKITDPANGCVSTTTTSVITNTILPILSTDAIPTTSLIAYWPFNGNANDLSGNGNNGTVNSASLTADRFGNPGRAYYFNGTSSRIDVPHSSTIDMMNGNDYTMAFWLKTSAGNGFAAPLSKTPPNSGWNGYYFIINSSDLGYCNGVGKFAYYVASGAYEDACANDLISNDTVNWYFITGQYKSSTNQSFLYVNGVLQNDIGGSSGTLSNTSRLTFGASSAGPYSFYKGTLDDIRFYKRLLTQSEINALYNEVNPVSAMTCETPSLTLRGFSPTTGVTYSWSPGGATTSSLNITTGGTYTLKVTNPANGCSAVSAISITKPLCITADVTNYKNTLNSGKVTLHISGGKPPYHVAWNNNKLPNSTEAYHKILSMGYPAGPDSVALKYQFDSLRQNTVYQGLVPGKYPVTIYDTNNDSLSVIGMVGVDIDTVLAKGIIVSTNSSHQTIRNSKTYLYGKSMNFSVSGSIITGQNLAVISHIVSPLNNNTIEFEVPETGHTSALGLTRMQEEIRYGMDDLDSKACFKFSGSSFSVKINNVTAYTGSFSSGDLFSMSNDASTGILKFYKNSDLVHSVEFSSIATTGEEFLFKAVLASSNAKFKDIVVVGTAYLAGISATLKDVSCSYPCSGSIDAIGRGILVSTPDKYELYSNASPATIIATVASFPMGNHALFTNLCAGMYTIKFYYTSYKIRFDGNTIATPAVISQTFEIAYQPDWVNVSNVAISLDRSLTKTGGGSNWDAGASTENFLKSTDNGWIEWFAPTVESANAVGFNDIDMSLNATDIDYANYYMKAYMGSFLGTWKLFMKMQNGVLAPVSYNFSDNQLFRLQKEVTGGVTTIKLMLNGVVMDQFSGITATDYVMDASLYQLLGTINHPRLSFGCKPSVYQYAVLKREADAGYYSLDGVNLRFTLDGEYTLSQLKFKVLDHGRSAVLSNVSNANLLTRTTTSHGDNRYTLDCSGLGIGYYILEVSNEKNEKLYLRFKR